MSDEMTQDEKTLLDAYEKATTQEIEAFISYIVRGASANGLDMYVLFKACDSVRNAALMQFSQAAQDEFAKYMDLNREETLAAFNLIVNEAIEQVHQQLSESGTEATTDTQTGKSDDAE